MDFKRLFRSAAACALSAALLTPSAAALADSADVISAALNEVGYTEGEDEYSKYGEWYGLPNAYWCDMFVSWCAMTGGTAEDQFPRECSCTSHVALFTKMGRYQNSAARGGSYIPQQGDVIFFYNYLTRPDGKICSHTGMVLYVEDGYVYTIEGNALANRLDYPPGEVAAQQDDSMDPPDYVVVNRYPLDSPRIHGYGIPAYDSRTPLALDGFVDLGRYAADAAMFSFLSDMGVMSGTSEHTFSPNHGMTRGEFLMLVVDFFGIPYSGAALPFDDVPPESPCYSAVMAARAAGLISGTGENCFQPDIYISPAEAKAILTQALACVELEPEFSFSPGDYSYIFTPYTTRADIAQAFYSLCELLPVSEAFDGQVLCGEEVCSARSLYGVCYVPAASLKQVCPGLELVGEASDGWQLDPAWDTDRVLPSAMTMWYAGQAFAVNGFVYQGISYADLNAAAEFLPLTVEQVEGEMPWDGTVTMVRLQDEDPNFM